MLSKWQIWDFYSSYDREALSSFDGVLALNTFDFISQRLVKDVLVKGAGGRVIYYKSSHEVTRSWIEEEFQTLNLFGNLDNFIILEAQNLSTDILELISSLDIQGRFIILSFDSENTGWKKLIKEGKTTLLQIEPPRFWETNKLLDFTCAHFRLPLSFESKAWILESLENNFTTFYNTCCLLKLNHPDSKEIVISQIKDLLTVERLDQFSLATLFVRKKGGQFYAKIVELEGDFEKMRGLFNFMQSHLIKLADVSYLAQKPRLTQYDKDLQSSSKLWREEEIFEAIERFNRWEILCKRKDMFLWHELRSASF